VVRDAPGSEYTAGVSVALRSLLPGSAATGTATVTLPGTAVGELTLFLGVANPLKGVKPLRFSNRNPNPGPDGRLILGRMAVP
jgi:hypothetical protein